MPSHWFCPIYGFNSDITQISLPEGLSIIRIPRELTEYLDRKYPHTLPTILSNAKWAIHIEANEIDTTNMSIVELMAIGFREQDNIKSQLYDLVTALRLHQKGRIVSGLLISAIYNNPKWQMGGTTIWTPVSNILFFEEAPMYSLKQSTLQKLIALYNLIRQCRSSGVLDYVEVALDRFHSAYHGNIEDRIIDQMIAFESLFISKDEKGIKKKLSFRTSFLIRQRNDYRNIVISKMKESYQYRSNIVHDNNPPNRATLREVTDYTGYYLRQSIIKTLLLLSEGKSIKQIRNILDKKIQDNIQNITY